MRKMLLLLMSFLIATALAGCAGTPAPKNAVMPMALTADQKEIVDLLSNEREILLFDFYSEENYESREIWVEAYEYGVLTNTLQGLNFFSDDEGRMDGRLAIVISHEAGSVSWSFTANEGGSRVSLQGEPIKLNASALGRAFGPINDPVEIVKGKEIVLYESIYSNGSIRAGGDLQEYIENPEALGDYPYAHLIKCKFE